MTASLPAHMLKLEQQEVALALVNYPNSTEAAASLGISRQTMWRIRKRKGPVPRRRVPAEET